MNATAGTRHPSLHVSLGSYQSEFQVWDSSMGRVFKELFALDTETTEIVNTRPDMIPSLVIASACDGEHGVFIAPGDMAAFMLAHAGESIIFHNAAFDLKVIQRHVGPEYDLYALIEEGKVWDTLILRRLLALATEGHTARGNAGLADCVNEFLGVTLEKRRTDDSGSDVRTGFGRFLGKSPSAIPATSLRYAAADPLATWHLFRALNERIRNVLRRADDVLGYVNEDWLREAVDKFGPLTHHIQLKASILMDEITRTGVAVNSDRVIAKSAEIEEVVSQCLRELDARGYRPGEKGNTQVIQNAIQQALSGNAGLSVPRTTSGNRWSTTKEHLATMAVSDPFFEKYLEFRHAQKLQTTYLTKMRASRVHPRFGYLVATGRTSCGGGLNLQNLPREDEQLTDDGQRSTIRGAFVPAKGHVFIDADLSQIELVVLAHVWKFQLRVGDSLSTLVNSGQDVHRLIAAAVLNKPPEEVTKADRNSAKPVSFGRPGGMGASSLQRIAKLNYGLELSLEDVEERIAAYHRLCPELNAFLDDEKSSAMVLAEVLSLTPFDYAQATGDFTRISSTLNYTPAAWLGGMLLKVLGEANPVSRQGSGRPYTDEEINYFWLKAQPLGDKLSARLAGDLFDRRPSLELSRAVGNWAGRRSVFTVTGRLRANATFCASRNTMFQGGAADGAILGLWRIWRAGFKIVSFIHDQVVVEVLADERVPGRVSEIKELMVSGFHDVTPGMRVGVEAVVTRSLDKTDVDPAFASIPQT